MKKPRCQPIIDGFGSRNFLLGTDQDFSDKKLQVSFLILTYAPI